jgi:glycosyltransferase involved in cell wall biosynthesis
MPYSSFTIAQVKRQFQIEVVTESFAPVINVNGMVGHDQLPLYYLGADVCGIPSYYEPFGLIETDVTNSRWIWVE